MLITFAQSVAQHLQDISVTIKSNNSEGSGVLFTRKDSKGNNINLVWTAGHVVDGLRSTREVISSDGSKKTIVEFQDAKVIKQILEDGRIIGRLELDAEIIKFSDSDNGQDLALLRLRKKNFVDSTVVFYLDKKIPELGTELYHVGSLLGSVGANSMTSGIYSQHGRLINKTIFDQTTVIAFPGSSGGGVFQKDGKYLAMLVRGSGEAFNLVIPIRRIVEWADKLKIMWAIDPLVVMPTDDELKLMSIEDAGFDFDKNKKEKKGDNKEFPTLINNIERK
ncbi:MAG: serine protease [Nanoarchaeota archaeon]